MKTVKKDRREAKASRQSWGLMSGGYPNAVTQYTEEPGRLGKEKAQKEIGLGPGHVIVKIEDCRRK